MGQTINRLNARAVAALKEPGRHADGGNLYLNITRSGARSWVFMYRFDGRQREMGLGSALTVPLARARELASAARQKIADGDDPMASKETPRILTFGECADAYITAMESSWRNAKHRAQWRMTLDVYGAPLKAIRVDKVGTEAVLKVLEPIWTAKPETASRVRGRIEAVLDWAKARGLRQGENPALWRGHLNGLLPKRTALSRGHHAAMAIDELPAFFKALTAMSGTAADVLQFTVLTAARTGESTGARWEEFDLVKGLWTVPAARMKSEKEHRVFLGPRAHAIVRRYAAARRGPYVFPGFKKDRPLSNMAMDMLLRRMKQTVTVHGFRSTFRDWAAERTNHPSEVIEMALAHVVGNKVEAAYRRGDLAHKRRLLLHEWEDFCISAAFSSTIRHDYVTEESRVSSGASVSQALSKSWAPKSVAIRHAMAPNPGRNKSQAPVAINMLTDALQFEFPRRRISIAAFTAARAYQLSLEQARRPVCGPNQSINTGPVDHAARHDGFIAAQLDKARHAAKVIDEVRLIVGEDASRILETVLIDCFTLKDTAGRLTGNNGARSTARIAAAFRTACETLAQFWNPNSATDLRPIPLHREH